MTWVLGASPMVALTSPTASDPFPFSIRAYNMDCSANYSKCPVAPEKSTANITKSATNFKMYLVAAPVQQEKCPAGGLSRALLGDFQGPCKESKLPCRPMLSTGTSVSEGVLVPSSTPRVYLCPHLHLSTHQGQQGVTHGSLISPGRL